MRAPENWSPSRMGKSKEEIAQAYMPQVVIPESRLEDEEEEKSHL